MKYRLRNNYTTDSTKAIKEILTDRGVKNVEAFMYPTSESENNPYDLDNIRNAAELLLQHLQKDSYIGVLVDADNDGFCSAAIIWNYIKTVYPSAKLYFILHKGKAHGLSDQIDYFLDEAHFDLLIIPDAGSYDIKYFWQLHDVHTDVICLDHHPMMYYEDGRPMVNDCPTAIVVNNQLSENYSNKDFCGAGVTYRFCNVLDDYLHINLSHNFIDLAAVGNIGDVMFQGDPETRYIIKEGLASIKNEGLAAMIEAQSYSLKERAVYPYSLTPIDIAFYICPLINAIVRVGTMEEKECMFYALTDPYKELKSTKRGAKEGDIELAKDQAARIAKNVKARQDRIKEKAISLVDFKIQKEGLDENNLIIVELDSTDDIPNELTGLIAQNVVSKYNKPCFIVRRDSHNVLKGSLRNNGNFQDLPALRSVLESTGLFELLAGHENACGVGIAASHIPSLLKFMNSKYSSESFSNCYLVDYILDARENNTDLLYSLAEHSDYYGNGIDEPSFIIKNIPLQNIQIMGANKDSIKISYNGIDYIKFKDLDFIEKIEKNRVKYIDIYGRVTLNNWMGRTTLQCLVSDYDFSEDEHKYDF